MIQSGEVLAEIRKNGITHVVGVPDNGWRSLYEMLWADPEIRVIQVAREGEAFALASGLFLGGGKPVVIIQNTGFFESGDAFRGTVINMGIPLVVIVGYRGYETLSGRGAVDTAATFFEPVLQAWKVPYYIMSSSEDCRIISEAFSRSESASLPVAVIYPGEMG